MNTCPAGNWSLARTFAQFYCCFTVSPISAAPEVGLWVQWTICTFLFLKKSVIWKKNKNKFHEIKDVSCCCCKVGLTLHTVTFGCVWVCVCSEPPWFAPAAQQQPEVCREDTTGVLPTNHGPYAGGAPPLPGHHQATEPGQAPLPPCQHSRHQGRM